MKHSLPSKTGFIRIGIFLAMAIVISNIFRFDLFQLRDELSLLPAWLFVLANVLLEGSGVFLGAIVGLSMLRKEKVVTVSLCGTSAKKCALMLAIPVILLTGFGVENTFTLNSNLYGLIAVLGSLIYCLMEELGWRGYLQEELRFLPPRQKYVTIGVVWYLWHLTFLTDASFGENIFFLSMMILGSWGIGQVADATKSIIAAACFHLIIQIVMFNSLIKDGLTSNEKIVVLIVCLLIWFVIVKKWEKENQSSIQAEAEVQ
ncbi:MAG: CPBP family intramembrane glutamic endopeptidase [Cyclobacteriaceae bacterium]